MDVRKILETIREVDEWTKRKGELEARLQLLPRSQKEFLRTELEIVRQQLAHYKALVEEMKYSVTRPVIEGLFEEL
ncbi:MAG: hypothetical protein GQ558_09545 [Thermoplasmata archaeon]|nr:hypothetical protein [Thermoplasmata archaeon]